MLFGGPPPPFPPTLPPVFSLLPRLLLRCSGRGQFGLVLQRGARPTSRGARPNCAKFPYRKFFRGIMFEICIRTFSPSLCMDIVAVFTNPCCQYLKDFLVIHFIAITCGPCIRTRAKTGDCSWQIIIFVLV